MLTVAEQYKIDQKVINQAKYYLRSRQIPATFIQREGEIAQVILKTLIELHCDLVFMGGYSKPPVIDVVLISPLDQIFRKSQVPVLKCR